MLSVVGHTVYVHDDPEVTSAATATMWELFIEDEPSLSINSRNEKQSNESSFEQYR